ncbi:hypothetical protein HK104_007886, partial [Borealophlyctis nickersoniae]
AHKSRGTSSSSGARLAAALDWLPPTLVSLDVSWNALADLEGTVSVVEGLPALKVLALVANPIFLLDSYRSTIISRLPKLACLDELPVTNVERRTISEKGGRKNAMRDVAILFGVQEMTGLPEPVIEPPEMADQPPDEYTFYVDVTVPGYNNHRISTPPQPWSSPDIDFAFAKTVVFPVGLQLRDAISDGVTLTLMRRKTVHVPKLPDADGPIDGAGGPDGRSMSSASSTGRPRVPTGGKKPAAAAPAKGGAGAVAGAGKPGAAAK